MLAGALKNYRRKLWSQAVWCRQWFSLSCLCMPSNMLRKRVGYDVSSSKLVLRVGMRTGRISKGTGFDSDFVEASRFWRRLQLRVKCSGVIISAGRAPYSLGCVVHDWTLYLPHTCFRSDGKLWALTSRLWFHYNITSSHETKCVYFRFVGSSKVQSFKRHYEQENADKWVWQVTFYSPPSFLSGQQLFSDGPKT